MEPIEQSKIAIECINQVGIEKRTVELAIMGLIPPKENKKYQQFLTCSYKKQGYQHENGTIIINNIKTFLSKYYNSEELNELNSCPANHPDAGETAYDTLICVLHKITTLKPIKPPINEVQVKFQDDNEIN